MRLFAVFLFIIALLGAFLYHTNDADADWRWAKPSKKIARVVVYAKKCDSVPQCIKAAQLRARTLRNQKVATYHARKLAEWRYWTSLYIPDCTWYGESGRGPEYAQYRYTMPNSTGSGAYGKFQFMSSTYHNRAKYHDWSPLDQEIAARREFWANGSSPWTNCH